MKILVVEDNEANLELFGDLLRIRGHDVLEAMSGKEALNAAKDNLPDIILMDIQLPEMNGLEATKILREETSTKDIPIVALTAHAMDGDMEKALECGCNAYITKPIDTRNFSSEIENIFNSLKG